MTAKVFAQSLSGQEHSSLVQELHVLYSDMAYTR